MHSCTPNPYATCGDSVILLRRVVTSGRSPSSHLLSLLPPPLILLSSSLSGSGPSIYFRSLSVAFVEYFVNSHQQDGRFCTRRERASKPQEISLGGMYNREKLSWVYH